MRLLYFFAFFAAFSALAGCDAPPPSTEKTAAFPEADVNAERFAAVAAAVTKNGGRAERDPQATNTVRLYVPGTVPRVDAERLALTAWECLGANANVRVYDDSGKCRARILQGRAEEP